MRREPLYLMPISRREALRAAGPSAAFLALLAASPLALYGCGSSKDDEQAARDSLDAELTRLTTGSASDLLGNSLSAIESLGISGDDFLGAFFDGCSWTTDQVSFQGGVATARVTLSCRSLTAVLDAMNDAYTAQTLEDGGTPSESSLYGTAGKALLECVHATALNSRSVDVTLAKQNGSWVVDDAGQSALISAFLGS